MRAYLWRMFAGSVGLTVAAELGVAILYLSVERLREGAGRTEAGARPGLRGAFPSGGMGHGARILLLTVLVNLLTNPPAVLVCWLGRLWMPPGLQLCLQLAVEALVVAVEGGVYGSFGRKPGWKIKRPMLFALAANGTSWLLGLWLS